MQQASVRSKEQTAQGYCLDKTRQMNIARRNDEFRRTQLKKIRLNKAIHDEMQNMVEKQISEEKKNSQSVFAQFSQSKQLKSQVTADKFRRYMRSIKAARRQIVQEEKANDELIKLRYQKV